MIKKTNIFLITLIILNFSLAQAVVKRKNSIDDEPGYVQQALAQDKAKQDAASGTPTSTTNQPKPQKNKNKIMAREKVPESVREQKKAKAAVPTNKKDSTSTWMPNLTENADSPEVKKNIEDEERKKEQLVDELLKLNYRTYVPPRALYNRSLDPYNAHLPPVYFQSDYLRMIFNAIDKNDYKKLRVMLENYQFLNEKHQNGDTILIYAIQNHSINSARLLLAKGALVDAVNDRNRTALHYAAALGDVDSVKLLLSMGADPYSRDDLDMTPVDYAQIAEQYQAEAIIKQYLNEN